MNTFERPKLHLRAWRDAAGLHQEQLAERIGYSRGYLAKAETTAANVTLAFLSAYAEGCGAPSVPALFSPPRGTNELRERLLMAFRYTPEHKRSHLVDVACGFADFTSPPAESAQAGTMPDPAPTS